VVLAVVGTALLATNVVGEVVLLFSSTSTVSGTRSPLRFIDGGNYASAVAEGLVTVTFPSTAQTALSASVEGADGAFGTYLLDVIEVQALQNTTGPWALHLDVVKPIAGTGISAAWVFDCTLAPSGVPDSGAPLANGTDAAGDPWSVYAPTCAGTQSGLSMMTPGTGLTLALPKLVFGTSVLFLSFAVAVAGSGASTTVPAILVLSATTP
jgi:hypothetical protein